MFLLHIFIKRRIIKTGNIRESKGVNVKKVIIACIALVLLSVLAIASINGYVKKAGGENIVSLQQAKTLENIDCIIVLGCLVKEDGNPSNMLSDRLKCALNLYTNGVAPKVIMSGDHGQKDYDEVNTMKKVAIAAGVDAENIFMDHAGFSTYESMYRAKEIFRAKRIVVVTQKYHLYRALYIAKQLGLEAYGVDAEYNVYRGQFYRELREILARCKDFVKAIFKPLPTFLGEEIPVSGNGNVTND